MAKRDREESAPGAGPQPAPEGCGVLTPSEPDYREPAWLSLGFLQGQYLSVERYSTVPVYFSAHFEQGVDVTTARSALEQLASDVRVLNGYLMPHQPIFAIGVTSQTTYEQLTGAQLVYVTKKVHPTKFRPYLDLTKEWMLNKPGGIPEPLRDKVKLFRLETMDSERAG